MARLQRQWGIQGRWLATPSRGESPWWQPSWQVDRAAAEQAVADARGSKGLEARLVSRVIGDLEVMDHGQASA